MKFQLLILMTMLANNTVMDGDEAFYRINTRTPAHELAKGVCADALNKRFEDGRAWPRFGVDQQPWGQPISYGSNIIPADTDWNTEYGVTFVAFIPPNDKVNFPAVATAALIPGNRYIVVSMGNASEIASDFTFNPNRTILATLAGQVFVCPVGGLILVNSAGAQSGALTTVIAPLRYPSIFGYARFNDPNGFDVAVVATDDWRDRSGEDGGRGRVWKVQDNNAPVQVPLNGDDIYGTARFIPCFNGLVLLRGSENERHYFFAGAVSTANIIQLNSEPNWQDGDQVFFWADPSVGSSLNGTSPPANGSFCFVRNLGSNTVSLYGDSASAINGGDGGLLKFTAAIGRFYLERRAVAPGYYGSGAPPLLAQGNAAGNTLWEVGFMQVPINLQVTNTSAATGVWTVPNHRLIPGDSITLANMPDSHTPADGTYYAWPLNDHQLQLFDTQVDALAAANGSTTGLETISNSGETAPTMVKTTASGLPMPPAREGYYTDNNQLVLVNGANNIVVSDALDPLHYTPLSDELTANLGEADDVVAIGEIASSDTLIIGKASSIMALYNFSEGPTKWLLQSVTREYGIVAPLTFRQWGSSLMFLSRRGLDRVQYTAFGIITGTPKPVSYDIQKYIDLIDWNNAALATVETWNNRLFMAYPAKGQLAGSVQNNTWLSLNFLNSDFGRDEFGWEGAWTGAALNAFCLARLTINGDERLSFVDYSGNVNWLGDGWMDFGATFVNDSLTTRRYGKPGGRVIWQKALVTWDTNNPLLVVNAQTPGWNEFYTLTPDGGLAYDRTKYLNGSQITYNPDTQTPPFNAPFRADYSLAGPGELIGGQPDVHQNVSEPFRMRAADWGVQLVIANSRGSCRINAVNVGGVTGPNPYRRRV